MPAEYQYLRYPLSQAQRLLRRNQLFFIVAVALQPPLYPGFFLSASCDRFWLLQDK